MADTAQGIGRDRVFELKREVGYVRSLADERVALLGAMTEDEARAWLVKQRDADERKRFRNW